MDLLSLLEGINVLSLFDGMSCGQIALERAKIKVKKYYASEIDKKGIEVTQYNYPNTIQLGDVVNVKASDLEKIDLIIGGSPCQGFSFAGQLLNFEDNRSKLFFEFVRLLNEVKSINPNVKFLLENVKMKKEHQKVISDFLGVEPISICSSNFSPHNRPRLYWTNIKGMSSMSRVKTGLVLKDIIGGDVHDKLYLNEKQIELGYKKNAAQTFKTGSKCGPVEFPTSVSKKGKCLTVVNIKGSRECNHIQDEKGIRILTRRERERLQTVPDGYTDVVSENKAFEMLGNGWTVDVIVEFFKYLKPLNNFNDNLDF